MRLSTLQDIDPLNLRLVRAEKNAAAQMPISASVGVVDAPCQGSTMSNSDAAAPLPPSQPQLVAGDVVEVRDDEKDHWIPAVFRRMRYSYEWPYEAISQQSAHDTWKFCRLLEHTPQHAEQSGWIVNPMQQKAPPVSPTTKVYVRFADGVEKGPRKAGSYRWDDNKPIPESNIIAYRLVEPE